MEKTEPKYNTIKLPIEIIYEVDRYMNSHKHEGFTTRVEVIKTALREFFKNGNNNYQPKQKGEMGSSPEGGGENPKGGDTNADMANRTTPEPDTKRLDDPKGEPYTPAQTGT